MSDELFQPSLKNQNYEGLKSYNITKLFYVAFIGGIIPTIALGSKNAKWLGIDKKYINFMMILGGIILFIKFTVCGLVVANYLDVSSRKIRYIYKIASVFIYIGYSFLMRDKFNLYNIMDHSYQPMLKDAIKWIIIAIIVEGILALIVGGIINSVL
ncbi:MULTISPECIES: hypothetical protein [Clostridium]|uniref:Uncharacterized protein n=1 Tax=Clostridium butyricum TaxID=1492 RepID=A0AAP9UES8_CLOBU|nr:MULTISPECIES: hypothetical protein [Clostridium]EMU55338.1 hypothetical protein CBDKU1_07640 [Clostridium butyricum DKU-01]MBZ0314321.1 hypothetical protein [Clostridium butyricum]MBZ5746752.1 hypothetical protein [Clostridium butyricum]MDI9208264.1 hypothetical protein [Clostridium butyricum]MDU4589557.1 hypothetical protein [Clostridium sp.]